MGAPAVTKKILLGSDQGQGIQISGAFVRYNGRLSLELTLLNLSGQQMNKFKIQFFQNSFGVSPIEAILQCGAIENGQSMDVSVPISANGPPAQPLAPLINMAMMVLPSQAKFYFQMNLPFHMLFVESGQLDREAYLSMRKSIPEANERTKDIQIQAPQFDVDTILRRLHSKNLFEIVRKKVQNQDVSFLSCKTENSIYILAELTFTVGTRVCRLTSKSTAIEFTPLFEHTMEMLINDQQY
ncbi:hypothetical protein SAMD00019534_120710 [Acytostelium subglobosum LB1]|uniref:hypothetical protein n=1 Tax=Acytostelium subglobosum LB1 TaxID=1410327 RepID=UPI0006451433|nr:hypothetical protein SAMD00019534_120710 [Acytostelium subglobosum LB1]GAM28895.1 hypothetical protein SAMD00019534_120710 [Acytostelium subglobosum LB1]|eukprot:XP_012748080.1 hypothetical protein SAMD00019534_120710 [Acytostelium subglobosum LB1]